MLFATRQMLSMMNFMVLLDCVIDCKVYNIENSDHKIYEIVFFKFTHLAQNVNIFWRSFQHNQLLNPFQTEKASYLGLIHN